jgi:hypothetical protein
MRRGIASALLLFAACSGSERELGRAVREYDDALVRAYALADASRLPDAATAKEAARVQVLLDLKSNGKLVLESKIEAFEVTRASSTGDSATAETRERWRYHDRSLKPGEPQGPEFVADMAMRYELVREGGRWKVASVATLSNEYLEPKGLKPGGAHGQGTAHGESGKADGPPPSSASRPQ